ncbi:MAG: response regulator [Candidatus Thermoplasmatota archaeon]|nr:response regulator [Candidatus Thermoplasmatota archaeon]MBU1941750.1 response regulator [Candidatus Thermoplasmatota archaeon]
MTKIMIVDDEPDLREMLNLMMNKEGYDTEIAQNGAEFLNKVEQFHPDIVTLDVMMPGLTTKEILEKLRTKEVNPKIVLLTVIQFSEEEKKKLKQMGNVVQYITKPFELDELLEAVKKNL